MSDEQNVAPEAATETSETVEAPAGKTSLNDVESLQKELAKVRAEAAKNRVEGRDVKTLEADARKWQEHVENQKSELERLQSSYESMKAELEKRDYLEMQRMIGTEAGIDPDLFEFVTGSSEDEMRSKAKKLAEKATPIPARSPDDLLAGTRGRPVVPAASAGGKFLESLARD